MKLKPSEADALAAIERGRTNIELFCREVLGFEPNKAQTRWFRYINPAEDGWAWRLKLVIHVAANQIGKTLGIAVLILWACHYKIGVPPPPKGSGDADYRDWISKPYNWFHLAPTQQQAYIPLDDVVLLIQGAHPAQEKGKANGLKCRWLAGLCSESKVEQYYRGLTFWNGSVCQFRTTEDKAKALQGRRAAGISFDEAAFEDHLKSVINETLMMRLVASGGPLFLVGTPNGINDYYEVVQSIVEPGEQPEDRVWVYDGGAVAWSIVDDNVGYGLTQAEVDRMESNLDETTKEQQLRGAFLEPAEAFFTPVTAVMEAFKKHLPPQTLPTAGRTYICAWDPSVSSDPTAGIVLDVTKKPWVGVAMTNHKKPLGINQLIQDIWATHTLFNSAADDKRMVQTSRALTVYDATSMGGTIIKQQLAHLHPQRPVNFGGPSAKIKMLTNLRAALASKALILPDEWIDLRRQLMNYRLKDEKIVQDLVMALAMAVDVASSGFSGVRSAPFSVGGRVTNAPLWR